MNAERESLLKRAEVLYVEMFDIRSAAKQLPYGDVKRWSLSIRASQIARELREITKELAGKPPSRPVLRLVK